MVEQKDDQEDLFVQMHGSCQMYLGGNGHPDITVIVANNGDDPLNGGSPAIVLNKMVPAV